MTDMTNNIDPLSFFVQPVSDPACEHCGMDSAALTEQLEAARADTKKAVEALRWQANTSDL